MRFPTLKRTAASTVRRPLTASALTGSAVALLLAGCGASPEGSRVAGWSLVDPSQRHPIMVTQKPTTLALRVQRGSYGLSPHQRAQVISFIERYQGLDAGNTRMVIEAPSGSANEVASMQAVAEIRALMGEAGFDPGKVGIEAVQAGGDPQAPIRISYLRYVAEGPECGKWPTNLAETSSNLNYPNLGCATQANFAAMVANPADLVRPRAPTARSGERDHTVWEKYVKGESTISTKQGDERVQVKGGN
jgi:pilus assembly protein CpaD